MTMIQIILIALFIYLGSIGSIVGNTFGWYTLGRPIVASLVVGVIMGDIPTALVVGVPLQIMYMGNVTPGGAVAWDLSYATYIGTAGALVFRAGLGTTEVIGLAVVFAGIGGLVGQLMWNISYAANLPLNRIAQKYANEGATNKMYIPNVLLGQLIGFACRFIPAVLVLTSMTSQH
jgi:mannose PTS system EIIC component